METPTRHDFTHARDRRRARRPRSLRRSLALSLAGAIAIAAVAPGAARAIVTPSFGDPQIDPFGTRSDGRSRLELVDIDGDGDLDVFVGGERGAPFFYRNTGTATSPNLELADHRDLGLAPIGTHLVIRFADVDADGDVDAWMGVSDGEVRYLENVGTAAEASFAAPVVVLHSFDDVGDAAPALADIDADGDLDAFVGRADGRVTFYENQGSPSAAVFASGAAGAFGLPAVGGAAVPVFADVDVDGDLDAWIGSESGEVWFAENVGSASGPRFASPVASPFGLTPVDGVAGPAFGDLDGDGDLDALVGSASGRTTYFAAAPFVECPPLPDRRCSAFAAGSLTVNEKTAGREQLVAQLRKGPALAQLDLGDPRAASGTAYALCVYGHAPGDGLVAQLRVDRAGEACGNKSCWKALGGDGPRGKGWSYADREATSDGVAHVALRGGAEGKSSLSFRARNDARHGRTALPTGVAPALYASPSVTVEVRPADVTACFSATLTPSPRSPEVFRAK